MREVRIGQTWTDGRAEIVRIVGVATENVDCPFIGDNGALYSRQGRKLGSPRISTANLSRLLSEPPEAKIKVVQIAAGGSNLYALADDGTLWNTTSHRLGQWVQIAAPSGPISE